MESVRCCTAPLVALRFRAQRLAISMARLRSWHDCTNDICSYPILIGSEWRKEGGYHCTAMVMFVEGGGGGGAGLALIIVASSARRCDIPQRHALYNYLVIGQMMRLAVK